MPGPGEEALQTVFGRFARARYLLQDAPPIVYALSASLLDPRLHRSRAGKARRGTVLAFGNPTARTAPGARATVNIKGSTVPLAPLPHAAEEVRAVKAIYGKQATVFLGAEATKARFLAQGGAYPMLLLSTHGLLNERHPMFSALVFAPDAGEYQVLNTHEIFNLSLDAELVALSACEVGLGRLERGEGLLGLGRAFLYAGASNLLVSLWSVDDESSSRLIRSFFERVHAAPEQRAAALWASKRELLRARRSLGARELSYAHPFFWAPFVMVVGPQGAAH
jgi:CHAT domain-containing protein